MSDVTQHPLFKTAFEWLHCGNRACGHRARFHVSKETPDTGIRCIAPTPDAHECTCAEFKKPYGWRKQVSELIKRAQNDFYEAPPS